MTKEVPKTPTRSPRQPCRQNLPNTVIVDSPQAPDLLKRLRDQEDRINEMHEKLTADLDQHRKDTEVRFTQMEASIEKIDGNTETATGRLNFKSGLSEKMESFMQNLPNMQQTQNYTLPQILDTTETGSPQRKK